MTWCYTGPTNQFFYKKKKLKTKLLLRLQGANVTQNNAIMKLLYSNQLFSKLVHWDMMIYTKVAANSTRYFTFHPSLKWWISLTLCFFIWCNGMGNSIPSLWIFCTFRLLFCCLKGLLLLLLPCFFLSLILQIYGIYNLSWKLFNIIHHLIHMVWQRFTFDILDLAFTLGALSSSSASRSSSLSLASRFFSK